MAKKKEKQVIAVKSPKVGEQYAFYFAGGKMHGTLVSKNEKLTNHYSEPWFTFEVEKGSYGHERTMKYPVSIYDITGKV